MSINNKSILSLVCAALLIICSSCSSKKDNVSSNSSVNKNVQTVVSSTEINLEKLKSLDNNKKCWGAGKITDNKRPYYAETYNQKYRKNNAVFVGENDKRIYLTFDEGYENGFTAPILDTLKKKKLKAVFFVTGDYVKRNPELVKRMIKEGHTVGNHSLTHPSMPTVPLEKAENEILELHNRVKKEFGYDMKLFRFPMGEFSERTLELCNKLGYKSVFWSFAYVDWKVDNQPPKVESLKKITSSAHNGAIFLLHAVSETNAGILEDVIESLENKGYVWSQLK